MISVFKQAHIYAPEDLGIMDLLVIGDKIVKMAPHIDEYDAISECTIYDCSGLYLMPGLIDLHVHITGGGGEQGPASRVPESQLSDFIKSGVTTAVGLLGTDGITRSVENLVTKARALTSEGMTCFALTGAYGYPSPTITDSIEKDIVMIDPIIGVKIAASDHRSSHPLSETLIDLAQAARRGGMIAGKHGLVTIHMGNGHLGLSPVLDAIHTSDIPAYHFLPTHMNRTDELMQQGAIHMKNGGYVDFTAGSSKNEQLLLIKQIKAYFKNYPEAATHLTLSSDAFGSQPRFNTQGICTGLTYQTSSVLLDALRVLTAHDLSLEQVLPIVTSNPAHVLGMSDLIGEIKPGAQADLLITDQHLSLHTLFMKGHCAFHKNRFYIKGRFE